MQMRACATTRRSAVYRGSGMLDIVVDSISGVNQSTASDGHGHGHALALALALAERDP
jgi:hypothetical protein